MGKDKFQPTSCRACGETFLPTRKHQVFCSARCRKRQWLKLRSQDYLSSRIKNCELAIKEIQKHLGWVE